MLDHYMGICTGAIRSAIKTLILQPISLPLVLLLRWGYDSYVLQTFDAIKLCDIGRSDEAESQIFCSRTVKALELIKENDTKRYRRVQRYLAYIVNCSILTAGAYCHLLRACEVNTSLHNFGEDEDVAVLVLACLIIHEATHGLMITRGIPYDYDKNLCLRAERLCHQEEVRFARRVMPEVDLGEFDETWFRAYYQMGKWRHTVQYFRYLFRPHEPAS